VGHTFTLVVKYVEPLKLLTRLDRWVACTGELYYISRKKLDTNYVKNI